MEFLIIHVYVYLWVVDGDEFLETESTWIWIIHSMTFIVSLWVVSGDAFLVTRSTDIRILPSMTLHVSLFSVPGDESFTTQNTLKFPVFLHAVAECESNVTQSTMVCNLAVITLQVVPHRSQCYGFSTG